jgi:predicted double-glycine peptidase
VICAIQAWSDAEVPGFSWAKAWEDGHYVIVLGLDAKNVYVEDPSLLGSRGMIPRAEFVERWHDYEGKPPYDKADRAYRAMGIFISGLKPAPPPAFARVE